MKIDASAIQRLDSIELAGPRAVLRQDGEVLTAHLLSPPGAVFGVESAEQSPPDRANQGVRRLVVRVEAEPGQQMITVLLRPGSAEEPGVGGQVRSIGEW